MVHRSMRDDIRVAHKLYIKRGCSGVGGFPFLLSLLILLYSKVNRWLWHSFNSCHDLIPQYELWTLLFSNISLLIPILPTFAFARYTGSICFCSLHLQLKLQSQPLHDTILEVHFLSHTINALEWKCKFGSLIPPSVSLGSLEYCLFVRTISTSKYISILSSMPPPSSSAIVLQYHLLGDLPYRDIYIGWDA